MCERFGCLPSALMEEDAELIRMLAIVGMGSQPGEEAGDG